MSRLAGGQVVRSFACSLCAAENVSHSLNGSAPCVACGVAHEFDSEGVRVAAVSAKPVSKGSNVKNFLLKGAYGLAGGILAALVVGFQTVATVPAPSDLPSWTAQAYGVIVAAVGTGVAAALKRGVDWLRPKST